MKDKLTIILPCKNENKYIGKCLHLISNQINVDNIKFIKKIIEYQDDYSIWRSDGSLDEYRFNDMMEEIRNEI